MNSGSEAGSSVFWPLTQSTFPLLFTPNPSKGGSLGPVKKSDLGFGSWPGHSLLPPSCQMLYISRPGLPHLSNRAADPRLAGLLRDHLS